MSIKAIVYEIYPGSSARFFPKIKTVVYVKSDLYDSWKRNPDSVKFEDVLEDPSVPVWFMYSTFSEKRGFIENNKPPLDQRQFWYGENSTDMDIAKTTAKMGDDVTGESEYKKPQ